MGGRVHEKATIVSNIKHVFVLMMENRSFDHFLGFSKITGTDTQTGKQTSIDGLAGTESNTYQATAPAVAPPKPDPGQGPTIHGLPQPPPPAPQKSGPLTITVGQCAPDITPWDPQHQFPDVMIQLCGPTHLAQNLDGGAYPAVDNSGFCADAANHYASDIDTVMECWPAKRLPVLTALAKEFVVCDHWYSSMAGPTEPNRMFVHAATSGTWDDSPSDFQQTFASLVEGISFPNGTIYDRIAAAGLTWGIYAGDRYPNVGLLKGINPNFIDDYQNFAKDISNPNYAPVYTFIEPRYDELQETVGEAFTNNSQHPSNSVQLGEQLIKNVYETIRASPLWTSSMLIVTWDEHGGFYDHVKPPRATPTGDTGRYWGFKFDQYGPRVPAVVISPLCPKNMIEHRQLEHSVIPATVEQLFGLTAMTVRDKALTGLQGLATLQSPRTDCPMTVSDGKATLDETSKVAPALTAFNGNLYLAWSGEDGSSHLNVEVSADGGATFVNKNTLADSSTQTPALCVHDGKLMIAWTGTDSSSYGRLNVAQLTTSGNTVTGLVNKVVLSETSAEGPSLASVGGRLYVAWRGYNDGHGYLNVMASSDGGATFAGKYTSTETSGKAPTLCTLGTSLMLAWSGTDSPSSLNVAQVAISGSTITGIGSKHVLAETTVEAPALTSSGTTLYVGWQGYNDGHGYLNVMPSTDLGASFQPKVVSPETSPAGLALCANGATLLMAWNGTDSPSSLNVAQVFEPCSWTPSATTIAPRPAPGANLAAVARVALVTPLAGAKTAPAINQSTPLDTRDPALITALAVAARAHIAAQPAQAAAITAQVQGLKTVGDLSSYLDAATPILDAAKTAARK
ncbi:MAG TPA: alkaline phosphatase family protein [Kofleriaceae bacterium]